MSMGIDRRKHSIIETNPDVTLHCTLVRLQRGRRQAAARLDQAQAEVARLQNVSQSERSTAAAAREDMVSSFMALERVVLKHQAALSVAMRESNLQTS